MMKLRFLGVAVAGLLIVPAVAQSTLPSDPNGQTPAIARPSDPTPAMPARGANSFTAEQAKSRIEANGYSNVANLKKGDDGVWRGTAQKGATTTTVALDYQGHVIAQQPTAQ